MSTLLLLCMAALVPIALAAGWWCLRPAAAGARKAATGRDHAPRGPAAVARASAEAGNGAARPAASTAAASPPAFKWRTEQDLEPGKRDELLAAIQAIPRPPAALQRLLSPEYLAQARAAELGELVMGEPLMAAKILASVNSPLYGLYRPVTDIGHAVTFLGIQRVRSLCLQYLLAESFAPRLSGAQKTFDALWMSSAIASELAAGLEKTLNLPAPSPLATQVVLGFVGQWATATLIPPTALFAWMQRDRLARARLEQELLGLNACEIGHLLLAGWALPPPLVADVRDGGRLLAVPPPGVDADRLPRLAVACLCARLGERLALGQLTLLEDYRLADDDAPDMRFLHACLSPPALARLEAALQGTQPPGTPSRARGRG